MIAIQPIYAFNDNYIWIMTQGKSAVVVDPGDATPVLKHLQEQQLNLQGILVTHHHGDHVGGVKELVKAYDCPVYGPANPMLDMITQPVIEGDVLDLAALLKGQEALLSQSPLDVDASEQQSDAQKQSNSAQSVVKSEQAIEGAYAASEMLFHVLEVPGHTLDHIAYYGLINNTQEVLFCGDTLFSCGSGRIFEGNSRMMLQSLDKFKKMPENTLMYCAHEYTLSNIKWALAVEPHNKELQQWQDKAIQLRAESVPTVPTRLGQELNTNPFLRVDELTVQEAAQAHAGQALETPADVLGALREWKNTF